MHKMELSMYKELSNTITKIVAFTNEHRIDAEFHIHTVGTLGGDHKTAPDDYWAKFEKNAGVYVFCSSDGNSIHYVGMSEMDTGNRLYNWLFNENKVHRAISSADLVLSVVLKDQPYMSPALESYLIAKLKPVLNVKNNA